MYLLFIFSVLQFFLDFNCFVLFIFSLPDANDSVVQYDVNMRVPEGQLEVHIILQNQVHYPEKVALLPTICLPRKLSENTYLSKSQIKTWYSQQN